MNLKALTLSTILGLSVPTTTAVVVTPTMAIAQTAPVGEFTDGYWWIALWFEGGIYHYRGVNLDTGDSLSLAGASVAGDSNRRVYIWRNGDYRYQVAWRPSDANVIRLQVFSPNGQEIMNSLMEGVDEYY